MDDGRIDRRTVLGWMVTAAALPLIPQETAGPYPGDGSNGPDALSSADVVRKDIRTSFGDGTGTATGVPLTIELVLVDVANGGAPLAGYAVYAWHCDKDGRYSMYTAPSATYLRGVQPSDASGKVTFTSVFPGCYPGRWPHIHFEVYRSVDEALGGGRPVATSQVALPKDACQQVYATPGYEWSEANLARISLESDGVFGDDGGVYELATVTGDVTAGMTSRLTVGV